MVYQGVNDIKFRSYESILVKGGMLIPDDSVLFETLPGIKSICIHILFTYYWFYVSVLNIFFDTSSSIFQILNDHGYQMLNTIYHLTNVILQISIATEQVINLLRRHQIVWKCCFLDWIESLVIIIVSLRYSVSI